ncbi:GD18760 [Drosophila simulans]|uniref:GD18760 n=1 Tax=Drosophila simulans TaxID=7240 RepID=B4QU32_DROSI|nr:GD18760 [Drosophila simulans]
MRWRHAVRATFTSTTAIESSPLIGKVISNSRAPQIAHEMLVEYFMALLVIMGLTAPLDKQSRRSSQYFGPPGRRRGIVQLDTR